MNKRLYFWLGLFALSILVLIVLHAILLPFVAGIVLAYFLDPLVTKLEKWKWNRLFASIFIILLFTFLFVLILIVLIPPLTQQLTLFVSNLPNYAQKLQGLITEQNKLWLKDVLGDNMPDISGSISGIISKGVGFAGNILTNLITGGAAVVSIFSLLIITPVVAFYLLLDWQKIIKQLDIWTPPSVRQDVHFLAKECDRSLSGFIRGQALVCLVLAGFYAVGLWLAGLNFGFIIGLMTGLFSFIPFVGAITGFVLAAIVAVVQFYPTLTPIVIVLVIFAVGQFLEGNILSPKLVGESVGLHPVWLMFALLAFGTLFGFIGLLVAVPVAAIIAVFVRFALQRYLKSDYYR